MNSLCNSADTISLKPLISKSDLHFFRSFSDKIPSCFRSNPILKHKPLSLQCCIKASFSDNAAAVEIDMVRNRQGIYTSSQNKVVVLWDLDNKPPRGPPYEAAMSLKRIAEKFGEVTDISAYANRHAFIHLPQWVVSDRRERKQLDVLERRGVVVPSELYICRVCGRKYKTNLDLKKHFKQLHERERQKKLNRMKSLKGKKRQKYKERYISGNEKYNEAARELLKPKIGYGLASELRRAGVYVKTVKDKPQAADWALKKQMQHSMSRGIDWMFLVSDDKDFKEMLRKAREVNLGTVVVGDFDRGLGRYADLWVPWTGVENGEVTEKDLVPKRRRSSDDYERDDNGLFSMTEFDGGVNLENESDLDSAVNEIVAGRTELGSSVRVSVFSEGEEEDEDWGMQEEYDEDYLLEDEEFEN